MLNQEIVLKAKDDGRAFQHNNPQYHNRIFHAYGVFLCGKCLDGMLIPECEYEGIHDGDVTDFKIPNTDRYVECMHCNEGYDLM